MKRHVPQADIEQVVRKIYERDGVCSPEALVEEASFENSPIHDLFDWDDTEAAAKWRKHQARQVMVRVKLSDGATRIPAFAHVTITRGDTRREGYVPTEIAMNDDAMSKQVFTEARAGLRGWSNRLAGFEQASGARTLIEEAIGELSGETVQANKGEEESD